MTLKRFNFGGGLLIALCLCAIANGADQPNIVLILADDMGYGDCVIGWNITA